MRSKIYRSVAFLYANNEILISERENFKVTSLKIAAKNIYILRNKTDQQYVNGELPDVLTGFRKDRGTKDQIANICGIIEAREFF